MAAGPKVSPTRSSPLTASPPRSVNTPSRNSLACVMQESNVRTFSTEKTCVVLTGLRSHRRRRSKARRRASAHRWPPPKAPKLCPKWCESFLLFKPLKMSLESTRFYSQEQTHERKKPSVRPVPGGPCSSSRPSDALRAQAAAMACSWGPLYCWQMACQSRAASAGGREGTPEATGLAAGGGGELLG